MKKGSFILAGISVATLCIASCSNSDKVVGTWQSTAPVDISRQLQAGGTATAANTITFDSLEGRTGQVTITSLIDITQPVVGNPMLESGYEVSIAATATIQGVWSYEDSEKDDIVIAFNPNSFKVDVDPAGVTFRQNIVTGAQDPVNDSITAETANLWYRAISTAMRHEFMRYSRLDDIKMKDKNTLKFEISDPEQELIFIR